MVLFAISTIVLREQENKAPFKITGTVAICTRLERALEIVQNNEDGIAEGRNTHVCIEIVYPDAVHSNCGQKNPPYAQFWYKWEGNSDSGRYMPCDQPKEFEHYMNIAIG